MIEFSVKMANQPGELATLARRLGDAHVNIRSLSALNTGQETIVKLVVDKDELARSVLEDAGISYGEHRVIHAVLADKPGALAEFTEALASTGVNIDAIYLLDADDDELHFALAVDDHETAAQHV